jgi:putative membrane protein
MKHIAAAAALTSSLALCCAGVTATAATASSTANGVQSAGQLSNQDEMFMRHNAQTDLAEITAGRYAAGHALKSEVRRSARDLVADHRRALSRLKDVAQAVNFSLPSEPNRMQKQQARQEMSRSAQQFDKVYLRNEIMGHQQSIADTRREITHGTDPKVRSFARFYLPIAREHLKQLQQDQSGSMGHAEVPAARASSAGLDASGLTAPSVTEDAATKEAGRVSMRREAD